MKKRNAIPMILATMRDEPDTGDRSGAIRQHDPVIDDWLSACILQAGRYGVVPWQPMSTVS